MMADFRLQGLLCLRIAIYWAVCILVVGGTMVGFSAFEGGPGNSGSVTRFLVPAIVVSIVVLPIVLFDMLVFSNKFAGPVLNFRKKFRNLVENQEAEEMNFRKGDFFPDLRDNYNRLCKIIKNKKSSEAE